MIPKTKLGKWSVGLVIAFWLLFLLTQLTEIIGRQSNAFDSAGANIFQILIPVFVIPAALAGIGAFVCGAIAIAKHKERGWLVFLSSLWGLLILMFVLGEFLVEH